MTCYVHTSRPSTTRRNSALRALPLTRHSTTDPLPSTVIAHERPAPEEPRERSAYRTIRSRPPSPKAPVREAGWTSYLQEGGKEGEPKAAGRGEMSPTPFLSLLESKTHPQCRSPPRPRLREHGSVKAKTSPREPRTQNCQTLCKRPSNLSPRLERTWRRGAHRFQP